MLVQDLFIPLLRQSEELQWLKVFLSLGSLASTSGGISVVEVGIGLPGLMWDVSVCSPAAAAMMGLS